MKRVILPILIVLCVSATAQVTVSIANDPPASREDVLKLFQVMQIRDQMIQVMRQVTLQMRSISHEQMKRQNPSVTAEDLAKIDARSEQIIEAVPVDDLLDDMIPVYQKHLTKGDVGAMVNFYSTPTGQKILHEMPAMTTEGIQAVQPRMRKIMDDTMRKAQETAKPAVAKPAPDAPRN